MSKHGVVSIHGNEYKTVALRVNEFREGFPDLSIETELISNADLIVFKAMITDENQNTRATGYAEEVRGSSKINTTSALENCETSAIGRALACFGLAGEEYSSADEISVALINQEINEFKSKLKTCYESIRNNFESISDYKKAFSVGDQSSCLNIWFDIDRDDRHNILSIPPSKGGILTTEERNNIIDSDEFREMYKKTSVDRVK